eukprot:gene38095-47012_t
MEISKAELNVAAAAAQASAAGSPELMGSEILVKSLQAENVQYIWGYPGGAVLYIYDALYKQDTIQHVLVRHFTSGAGVTISGMHRALIVAHQNVLN